MNILFAVAGSALLAVVALLLVVGLPVLYVIRQMGKPPANSPERFVAAGGRDSLPAGTRVLVCTGASIVHGRVGVSFVDLLAKRLPAGCAVVNAGVNGDTSLHLLRRLDSVVACRPDAVAVLVGNNDVTCTLNPDSWRAYRGDKRLTEPPTLDSYRETMRQIVRRLRTETGASVALCSLPPMGEDLSALGNVRVREFNVAIRDVAAEEGAAYLPVYETEAAYLEQRQSAGGPPPRPYTGNATGSLRMGFLANLQHYLFGRNYDDIAYANGMMLKVDLIHSTTAEAEIIARCVEECATQPSMQREAVGVG